MKIIHLTLLTLFAMSAANLWAQDDDMYFVPKRKKIVTVQERIEQLADQRSTVTHERDVDEYNRRGGEVSVQETEASAYVEDDDVYMTPTEDTYNYSVRLTRFHGYYAPFYAPAFWYAPGWATDWYGYYDPWYDGYPYYGGWYGSYWAHPYYYGSYWHRPYYYGGWGWHRPHHYTHYRPHYAPSHKPVYTGRRGSSFGHMGGGASVGGRGQGSVNYRPSTGRGQNGRVPVRPAGNAQPVRTPSTGRGTTPNTERARRVVTPRQTAPASRSNTSSSSSYRSAPVSGSRGGAYNGGGTGRGTGGRSGSSTGRR